jgi:choloylglycine hydrolase
MNRLLLYLTVIIFTVTAAFPARSCTTFVLEDGKRVYLGRNLDWDWEDGLVIVNARNVHKRALVQTENALKWTSKFGSVTFNQFGRDMPFGGMNEAGLVVENMWLDGTKYPDPDTRPEVNMLQWIQYQLDTCSNIAQVIASDKVVRLENTAVRARIHYLVCDAKGDCATIEFLDGKMSVHQGKDLPYHALANDTYASSVAFAREHVERDGGPLVTHDSLPRFCRAATRAQTFKAAKTSNQDVDYAFETLEQVRQGNYTAWQIVYNIADRQIDFRTRGNTQKKRVDLKSMNFECNRPTQFADIRSNPSSSGALEFQPLEDAVHRKYLTAFFGQDSLKASLGDFSSMLEPLLMIQRAYTCAE